MSFVRCNCVLIGACVLAACASFTPVVRAADERQSSQPPQQQQQQQQQQRNADQAQPAAATDSAPAPDAGAQARAQAQARPEIEQQRRQAEQQARQSLDADAIAAIQETQKALQAISAGKADEALASIERASGKINVITARKPAVAMLPVGFEVAVIDAAPLAPNQIKQVSREAERAVKDHDYPAARLLLQQLTSEIHVRTQHLPLATYPVALREAARLLDAKKPDEAAAALQVALNTLVVVDRAIPLPLALVDAAVAEAQELRDKNKDQSLKLLSVARSELERARLLGYASSDPEYQQLSQAISDVEKQVRGNENSQSTFARLKERVSNFFHKLSGSEKRSTEVARG